MRIVHWLGISFVVGGVLWEHLFAPNLTGWVLVVFGLGLILVREAGQSLRTPLDGPIFILVIMAVLSLYVSASFEVTQILVRRLGISLLGFYGIACWFRDRSRLWVAMIGLTLVGGGLAVLSPFAVDWLRNKAVLIPDSLYAYFPLLLSDTVHPNVMASSIALLWTVPLSWLLQRPPQPCTGGRWLLEKGLPGVVLLLMFSALVLTKSRGGYLAAAVSFIIVLWLSGKRRGALVAFSLFLVLSMGLVLSSNVPELLRDATDPSTWEFRKQVWRIAIRMIGAFPFTGVGMGMFNQVAVALYPFQETQNPGAHNLYLQVGLDLGIPGLIAFLAILGLMLWMAFSNVRLWGRGERNERYTLSVGLLGGLLAMLVHGIVDIAVWGTRVIFLPWFVFGLIFALYRMGMEQRSLSIGFSQARIGD